MAMRELNKMPAGLRPPASTIGKPTKASTYRAASLPTGRRRRKRPVGKAVRVGRHVVGHVLGDTFYKTLQPGHFLRNPPAICFDISSLADAEALGARKAHVTNAKTGQVYQAAFSTIRARGFPVRRVSEQVGLELRYWQTGCLCRRRSKGKLAARKVEAFDCVIGFPIVLAGGLTPAGILFNSLIAISTSINQKRRVPSFYGRRRFWFMGAFDGNKTS